MSDIWLFIEPICELTGWHPHHIQKLDRQSKITSRPSTVRAANGKPRREYLLSSLPLAAQLKYAQGSFTPAAATPALTFSPPPREPGGIAVPAAITGSSLTPPGAPNRPALPPDLDTQAASRFAAIEPLINFRNHSGKRGDRPTFKTRDGRNVSNLNELAEYVAAQQVPPISSRTLYRWLDRFDARGFAALADAPRKDRGVSRLFSEHANAAAFVQQKFLNEGLSARLAWESLCREWSNIERKGEAPSYSTVRDYIAALPKPLTTLAREGAEKYHAKCSPFIQRSKQRVMDWWIADHRTHDVMVRNRLFAHLKDDQAYRVYLTLLVDWGSQKFIGWTFAPTPSSRTIYSALRMSLAEYGFPRNFYWDNGKDFQKVKARLEAIDLSTSTLATLKREGVSYGITSALPFHPRSKPIESYFTRISRRFDPLWKPAYLGNKPGACPPECREAQKQHDEYLRGKHSKSPLPTDAEFILGATKWIEEYNARPMDRFDGRSPNEVFDESFPITARNPVPRRALDFLLSSPIERTVQQGGCVRIEKVWYEPSDFYLGAMSNLQGRKVLLIVDDYNLAEAVAVDAETGEFIAEMAPKGFVGQDPSNPITRDMIQAHMRNQRSMQRARADWLGMLAAIASASGWKTERQSLLERAGLKTGTDDRMALPSGAVPGAMQPRKIAANSSAPRLAPAFVSDAVEPGDAALFAQVEEED